MNKRAEKRTNQIFHQVNSSLMDTDPEFVDIISNFSEDEMINVGHLSEKERILCILSVLLGRMSRNGRI